ncbi:hypothetical protein SNEBB_002562 [Seison nebaliae]|nr:hypothetical protein SNEBB_002562 [Seison nebaliae]
MNEISLKSFINNNRMKVDYLKINDVELFKKHYTVLNTIGRGTYGKVFRAQHADTGKIVAVKQLTLIDAKTTDGILPSYFREINLLRNLSHENLVQLIEIRFGERLTDIYLILQYCEQDLRTLIDRMDNPFCESQIKCIVRQMLNGLEYLHFNRIVHRDLKVSNLLLTDEGVIKIADFGLARQITNFNSNDSHATIPNNQLTPTVVSLWYRPPELLLGAVTYDASIDMWSCGCIIGELYLNKPLFPGRTNLHQLELIINMLGTPTTQIWPDVKYLANFEKFDLREQPYNRLGNSFPSVSMATLNFIKQHLIYDPSRRITSKKSANHKYFEENPLPITAELMPTFPQFRNDKNFSVFIPSNKMNEPKSKPKISSTKKRHSTSVISHDRLKNCEWFSNDIDYMKHTNPIIDSEYNEQIANGDGFSRSITNSILLDPAKAGPDVVLVKSGKRICGNGAVLCNVPVVQNKCYFEVKIQSNGIWGIGFASPFVDVKETEFGNDPFSCVLKENGCIYYKNEEISSIKEDICEGDTFGITFDHEEIRFYKNGESTSLVAYNTIRGRVHPIFYVGDNAVMDVEFSNFQYEKPNGFDQIMLEKNIL